MFTFKYPEVIFIYKFEKSRIYPPQVDYLIEFFQK